MDDQGTKDGAQVQKERDAQIIAKSSLIKTDTKQPITSQRKIIPEQEYENSRLQDKT